MCELIIETLDPIKVPLVSRLYKAHYPSGKAKKNEHTLVGYFDNQLVAVVRFRAIESYRLLTGMLVIPSQRSKGFANQLMLYCQQHELSSNDYCFAYSHLSDFYQQHGFAVIAAEELPNSLKTLFLRYTASGKSLIPMHFLPQ